MAGFKMCHVEHYDSGYTLNGQSWGEDASMLAKIATLKAPIADRHVVILCHGNTDRAGVVFNEGKAHPIVVNLLDVDQPWVVYSIDAGGASEWGNDNASAKVKAAYDFVLAQGYTASQVYGLGLSMGNLSICSAAKEHDIFVRMAGIQPIISLSTIHDNDIQSAAASIATAYGGTYITASERGDHDPEYLWKNTTNPYGRDWLGWYGGADQWQVTPAAYSGDNPYTDCAAADTECNVVLTGASDTHSWGVMQAVSMSDLSAWFLNGTVPS